MAVGFTDKSERVDAVGMWSIPLPQRPAGQAYLVVAMHLLGDVPSPPIVGALQGIACNSQIIARSTLKKDGLRLLQLWLQKHGPERSFPGIRV